MWVESTNSKEMPRINGRSPGHGHEEQPTPGEEGHRGRLLQQPQRRVGRSGGQDLQENLAEIGFDVIDKICYCDQNGTRSPLSNDEVLAQAKSVGQKLRNT